MSRRRYVSTEISIDKQVNRMGMEFGDAPVLLYTWMIPHTGDDGTVTGDPFELLNTVWPGRRDKTEADVVRCLEAMEAFGLVTWDRVAERVYFPAASFYKYQTYIKPGNRRDTEPKREEDRAMPTFSDDQRKTPEISEDQRASAQNTASLSLSPSLSLSKETATTARVREGKNLQEPPDTLFGQAVDYLLPVFGRTQLRGKEGPQIQTALAQVNHDWHRFQSIVDELVQRKEPATKIHSFGYFVERFAEEAADRQARAAPRQATLGVARTPRQASLYSDATQDTLRQMAAAYEEAAARKEFV